MANLFREEFARKRGKNISNGNVPILREWWNKRCYPDKTLVESNYD